MSKLTENRSEAKLFASLLDANKAKRKWNAAPPIPGTLAMADRVETCYGTRWIVSVRGPWTRQRPSWDKWDFHGYF